MKKMKTGLVLILVLAIAGCTAPFSPDWAGSDPGSDAGGSFGGIRILGVTGTGPSGEALFTASTALPTVAYEDVKALRITLEDGPDDAVPVTAVIEEFGFDENGTLLEPVEVSDIVPGEWLLTVEALDAAPDPGPAGMILRGVSSVDVSAGEITELPTVTMGLIEDAGDGGWLLTVTWPPEDSPAYPVTDVVDTLAWRIGSEGTWSTVAADTEAVNGVYSQEITGSLPAGDHLISVELRAGDKPSPYNTVARYDEIWRISSNVMTRKTIAFTKTDFAYGGGAGFTVLIDLPEDLEAFFEDAPDSTVIAGNQYSINAAQIAGAQDYRWRVNGEDILQGSEETVFAIDTAEGDAGTVLLVTLIVEVDGRLYSGAHRVRVEAP